jgi:hypothetical protein
VNRTYDLFEKMPNGDVLWRGCVSGLEPARRKLARCNGNEYLLMHVPTSEIVECMEERMTEPKFPIADRVEKRAYEFYLARGRADGYDVEDWLAAERDLKLAEVSPKPKARPAGAST